MKRIFFIVLLISIFSAFAELHPAKRYVELGVNVDFHATENFMPVDKIFQKELVLDMSNIYSRMGRGGFVASAGVAPEAYLDFNFCKFGMGIHAGAELSGRVNISKDLFGILAEGLSVGQEKNIDMNLWLQTFVTASLPFYFRVGRLKFSVTPTYFMPFIYIPYAPATATVKNNSDGTTKLTAKAPLEIYTVRKFEGIIGDGNPSIDFLDLTMGILRNGGFDLGVMVEYPFSKKLDIGGYANIPLMPARLNSKISTTATAEVTIPSVMDMIFSDGAIEQSFEFSEPEYSEETYKIHRPLRVGAEISYHPWKKWMTLSAAVGIGMRNPFGKDFSKKSVYPEYKLCADFVIAYFLGLGFHTEYTQKVFAHTFEFILNARVLEIDIAVALANSDFVNSFKLEGARGRVGFKMGW